MQKMVEPITADQDDKLNTLKSELKKEVKDGKCLIFTQYADTAEYLETNLWKVVGGGRIRGGL